MEFANFLHFALRTSKSKSSWRSGCIAETYRPSGDQRAVISPSEPGSVFTLPVERSIRWIAQECEAWQKTFPYTRNFPSGDQRAVTSPSEPGSVFTVPVERSIRWIAQECEAWQKTFPYTRNFPSGD